MHCKNSVCIIIYILSGGFMKKITFLLIVLVLIIGSTHSFGKVSASEIQPNVSMYTQVLGAKSLPKTRLVTEANPQLISHPKTVITDSSSVIEQEYSFMPNPKDATIQVTGNFVENSFSYYVNLTADKSVKNTMRFVGVGYYKGNKLDLEISLDDWEVTGGLSKFQVLKQNMNIVFTQLRFAKVTYTYYLSGTNTPQEVTGFFNFNDIDNSQSILFYESANIKQFYAQSTNTLRYVETAEGIEIGDPRHVSSNSADKDYWITYIYEETSQFSLLLKDPRDSSAIFGYTYEAPAKIETQPVYVHYLDEENASIIEDVIIEGEYGETYTTEQKNFDGYRFISASENSAGSFDQGEIHVYYHYEEIKTADITVHYVDKNLESILTSQTTTENVGETYNVSVPAIDHYKYQRSDSDLSFLVTSLPQEVTLIYSKIQTTITIHYQDNLGTEIKEDNVVSLYAGDMYTVDVPEIKGYQFVPSSKPLTLEGEDTPTEVTLTYSLKSTPVVIKYQDKDGRTLKEDISFNLNYGTEYQVSVPTLNGYTYLSSNQATKLIISEEPLVIILTYQIEEKNTGGEITTPVQPKPQEPNSNKPKPQQPNPNQPNPQQPTTPTNGLPNTGVESSLSQSFMIVGIGLLVTYMAYLMRRKHFKK